MSETVKEEHKGIEFGYRIDYDSDRQLWYARGYASSKGSQAYKNHTTEGAITEAEASAAFRKWAIHWIDSHS